MLQLRFSLKQGLTQNGLCETGLVPLYTHTLTLTHTKAHHYLTPDCDSIPNVQVKGLWSNMPDLEAVKAETESSSQGETGDRKNEGT